MSELYESEDFIYNRIPIRIFNHCFDGIEIFTPTHWHRNIEFNLVTCGRIRRIVDGIQYGQMRQIILRVLLFRFPKVLWNAGLEEIFI